MLMKHGIYILLLGLLSAVTAQIDCSVFMANGAAYFRWKTDPRRVHDSSVWDYTADNSNFENIMVKPDPDLPATVTDAYKGRAIEVCPTSDCPSGDDASMIIQNPSSGVYRLTNFYDDALGSVTQSQYLEVITNSSLTATEILKQCADCQRPIDDGYPFSFKVDLRNARIPLPNITIYEEGDGEIVCQEALYCQKEINSNQVDAKIYLQSEIPVECSLVEIEVRGCTDDLKCIVPAVVVPIIGCVLVGLAVGLIMKKIGRTH